MEKIIHEQVRQTTEEKPKRETCTRVYTIGTKMLRKWDRKEGGSPRKNKLERVNQDGTTQQTKTKQTDSLERATFVYSYVAREW